MKKYVILGFCADRVGVVVDCAVMADVVIKRVHCIILFV